MSLLSGIAAQDASDESKWETLSPHSIWTTAESKNRSLPYLLGRKDHSLNHPTASFVLYQRSRRDGSVETKFVESNRGRTTAEYSTKEGKFIKGLGMFCKIEFEDYEEVAQRIAATMDRPFVYRLVGSEFVGTNECIIVSRLMSDTMLDACATVFYPAETTERRRQMASNIRAERRVYIRKGDFIALGYLENNTSGKLLNDRLCNSISTNPIPDEEFVVPDKESALVAKSFEAYGTLITSALNARSGELPEAAMSNAKNRRAIVLAAFSVFTAVSLLFLFKVFLRHGRTV